MIKTNLGVVSHQVNLWYGQLDEAHREQVRRWAEDGGQEFLINLMAKFEDQVDLLREWQTEIRQRLRERNRIIVQTEIIDSCPNLPKNVVEAVVKAVESTLKDYRLSAELRKMDPETFAKVVERIFVDNYLERRYDSWDKCDAYLGLNDEQKTKQCYLSVMNIIEYHYSIFETLEQLEGFMQEELEWDGPKAGLFTELVVRYREALDRTMLFKKLRRLEQLVQDSNDRIE
ncbi:hypothetical protein [Paenibacillus sp.]|uniref:hypothetical protein n=1 Tax=Paenibacillus sp. TaxID=58172 RepID=UPI0028114544|nr:hypothetical protein [Paenibacillus sp.]